MSPLGIARARMKPEYADLTGEARLDVQMKQGHPPFGVEMKITDDDDRDLPRDGKTFGRLKVRGPAVAKSYFKGEGDEVFDEDGWFDTGDVATIDPARLHADHRPRQGRDQVGRRMDLVDRPREPRGRPSRRSRRPRSSASRIRNGTSGRCWSSCSRRARRPARRTCSASCRARSPNGGCRTTSSSSTKSRTPRPARSRRSTLREQFKDYRLPTTEAAE